MSLDPGVVLSVWRGRRLVALTMHYAAAQGQQLAAVEEAARLEQAHAQAAAQQVKHLWGGTRRKSGVSGIAVDDAHRMTWCCIQVLCRISGGGHMQHPVIATFGRDPT
jgi:hypothetical protein